MIRLVQRIWRRFHGLVRAGRPSDGEAEAMSAQAERRLADLVSDMDVIIWIAVSKGSPSTTKVARQLRPIANATGTPSTRKATKLRHKTVNAMTTPPCFQ